MIRLIYLVVFALTGIASFGQNKELLYDFVELPQSLLLNPGTEVRFDKHIGIPLLSQFHFNTGVTGITAYDIFADDGRDINAKISEALIELNNRDSFTITQQLEVLNFGWRNEEKELYFSGGIYQEFDFIGYFPSDFANLAYFGNEDPVGKDFDFDDLKSAAELLMVYHFGFNKKVNEKLTAGLRLKIYSEIASYRATNNSGVFKTDQIPNGNNIYEHTLEDLNLNLDTSGYVSLKEEETDDPKEDTKEIISRALLGGNLGLGVDFGLTYQLEDNWVVTGSVTDLGFIVHSKDVESYQARGTYVFDGFETPTDNDQRGIETFVERVEAAIDRDTINRTYTTMRPTKIYGSLRKNFNKRENNAGCDCWWENDVDQEYSSAFGVQVFSQFRPRGPQFAGSFFLYHRIFSGLRAKATYTIDKYSFNNVGLLLSTNISKFNFYLAANNLTDYANLAKANSASVQFGFNLIF